MTASSVVKYAPLLGLSIQHAYYPDGRCADFSIEPRPSTERLLRNHRLVNRARPDGIRVVAPLDKDGNPFIPLDPGTTFEWYLRAKNPDLALMTDPSDFDAHRIARYRNTGGPTSSELVSTAHPEPESLAAGTFATIEITLDGVKTVDPHEYFVSFDAASAWWSYYLVTDLQGSAGEFALRDTAPHPLLFDIHDLVAEPDRDDAFASALAAEQPDLRRFRFRSDRPVPARLDQQHRVELWLDDQRAAGPLPFPKSSSLSVEFGQRTYLNHVVRYPDRPPAKNGV